MDEARVLTIPRETANDDFVILTRWLVDDGQRVDTGMPVALFETSKATVELLASNAGYLYRTVDESAEVSIGAEVARIEAQPTAKQAAPAATPADDTRYPFAPPPPSPTTAKDVVRPTSDHVDHAEAGAGQRWSKKATELANQHNLPRELFKDKALVREEDVQAVLASRPAPPPPDARPTTAAQSTPASQAGLARVDRVVRLSAVKRTEIRYLRAGNAEALVSTITVSMPTARLDAQIAAVKNRRLTYLTLLLPVVARTLREYPELNAFLDDDGIHYYADVNVGVAVNFGEGLFVPVLHDADQMTRDQVASAMSALTMKAVRGELRETDLIAGTFTITDLTDAGAEQVLPLLNRHQTAILAVGIDTDRPLARLNLTLAFDHRVSDGLQAAQFLGAVKQELNSGVDESVPIAIAPVCISCRMNLRRLREDGVGDYLISVIDVNGEQALLCPTCLLGFTS